LYQKNDAICLDETHHDYFTNNGQPLDLEYVAIHAIALTTIVKLSWDKFSRWLAISFYLAESFMGWGEPQSTRKIKY